VNTWVSWSLGLATVIVLVLISRGARAGIKEGGPDTLNETKSLGRIIRDSGSRPVHIIFVHGMRATGPGSSNNFRHSLCKYLEGGCSLVHQSWKEGQPRQRLDIGAYPKNATMVGTQIWANRDQWLASRPFVDRYVYSRPGGGPIVIDEVNWWPLLFPLKCRFLLMPDVELSGADKDDLRLCAKSADPYYNWVAPEDVEQLIRQRPQSGGGAWLNALAKQQIMNWGLSDAVITAGPMQVYIRRALNVTFEDAAKLEGKTLEDQEFVVISESLGSFAVLDAFMSEDGSFATADGLSQRTSTGVSDVLAKTFYLYFFANQFPMLELARIENVESPQGQTELTEKITKPMHSPFMALKKWAAAKAAIPRATEALAPAGAFAQIIAFSDPSDLLTFKVPKIENAKVVNLFDHNAISWFGLFENPVKAHTGHSGNSSAIKAMLTP